jgi:hypothetical protein
MTCSTSYCCYDTMIHGKCIRKEAAQRVMHHNFFSLQVTELVSCYFRQYKFELTSYYVQIRKGSRHSSSQQNLPGWSLQTMCCDRVPCCSDRKGGGTSINGLAVFMVMLQSTEALNIAGQKE